MLKYYKDASVSSKHGLFSLLTAETTCYLLDKNHPDRRLTIRQITNEQEGRKDVFCETGNPRTNECPLARRSRGNSRRAFPMEKTRMFLRSQPGTGAWFSAESHSITKDVSID